jgi:hypothetical protein
VENEENSVADRGAIDRHLEEIALCIAEHDAALFGRSHRVNAPRTTCARR